MALEVHNGQHARFGLETEHSLVRSLVLPSAGLDEGGASEIRAFVAVDVAGDEDVGDFTDDQTVLGFRRERCLSTPLRSKMATAEHFSHRLDRFGIRDGFQPGYEIIDGFSMI